MSAALNYVRAAWLDVIHVHNRAQKPHPEVFAGHRHNTRYALLDTHHSLLSNVHGR